MRLFTKIWALAVLAALLAGCRKPTVANWDVDLVVPIVNSELNIKNFIGDSIFKADNTGLLSLSISREITSIKLDSLLTLPDTTISNSFTVPIVFSTTITPGEKLSFLPASELNFNISNGVALKKVEMRSGSLTLKFSNYFSQPLDILYVIPGAVKNGQPLTITETVPPGVNSLSKDYDLAGYSFNMQGISGNIYNTVVQAYTVTVNSSAVTVVLPPTGTVQIANIDVGYNKLVPQYVEGYFGQQVITVPLDTTKLNLLNNIHAANFMLNDASLNFKILNEFGAEFSGNLSNIKSINSAANNIVALSTSELSNVININRATKTGTTVFPSIKSISLVAGNSNIVPFLSNLPDKLTYQGSISVNPLGNISGYNDFAFYGKGIHVLADINIPMRFSADYFMLKSNAAVDFSNIEQLKNVRSGNFVILAKNGYPFRARLQAYMLDKDGQVIDSLFVPGSNIIESGLLDNQNNVTAAVSSKVLIPINSSKISSMQRCKSIQIFTYFLMPPSPPDIKIYEDYKFDVNIVAELTYNVKRS